MKLKTIRIAAALALTVCAAFAQGKESGSTTPPAPPTPAQTAANIVARLTMFLDLTSSQQSAAIPIFTTEITSLQTIGTSLGTAHTTLIANIEANNTTGISTEAQAIGALTQQAVEASASADAAFYAVLTSTQQTKLGMLSRLGLGAGGFGGALGSGALALGVYGSSLGLP